jgi:hypothetical protein
MCKRWKALTGLSSACYIRDDTVASRDREDNSARAEA